MKETLKASTRLGLGAVRTVLNVSRETGNRQSQQRGGMIP